MFTDAELEAQALSSPVRRSEADWLAIVGHLLRRLKAIVPGEVRLGPYWIGNDSDRSGSFGCRLASEESFPFVPSDAWEAAFCITGDAERAWADIDVFPFRNGRKVGALGRFWNIRYGNEGWRSLGWRYSDGPGEWEWVNRRGICFFSQVRADIVRQPLIDKPPILCLRHVNKPNREVPKFPCHVSVSLSRIERDGTVLTPPTDEPTRLSDNSEPAIRIRVTPSENRSAEFALGLLSHRNVWSPGSYTGVLRVRRTTELGWGDGLDSDISQPFGFDIKPSSRCR